MHDGNLEIYVNIYDPIEGKIISEPLEQFVKVLVAWSIPLTFHIEALKCQSIIMRTKILRQMKSYGGLGEEKHPGADVSLEEFKGILSLEQYKKIWGEDYDHYMSLLDEICQDTKGKVILFNNKPIDARTHLVCGGSTENSENVDGNIVQYLRKVLCYHCTESPFSLNYKDISVEELEEKLGLSLKSKEVMKDAEIEGMISDIERDEENRVVKIKVGNTEFEGKEMMKLLDLNSTRFGWQPQIIRFFTIGKGDGVGLCQYGANQMAIEGKKAEEILKYYYTGVEIKRVEKPCINKPLKGKLIVVDPGHGGNESEDYTGKHGAREKEINLSIALYFEEILKELGATVYLTRRRDETVHLNERAKLSNEISPHFFISIHQNHFSHPSKSGTEIYYFRGDKEARSLAQEMMKTLTEELNTLDRGIKAADFFLLREVAVSALHVEIGYLSNEREEKQLMEEAFQRKAAEAMAQGIVNYYRYI